MIWPLLPQLLSVAKAQFSSSVAPDPQHRPNPGTLRTCLRDVRQHATFGRALQPFLQPLLVRASGPGTRLRPLAPHWWGVTVDDQNWHSYADRSDRYA